MPVISSAFRLAVKQLSDKEKEAVILKAVRRDAELYDLLSFELLEEVTLADVYAQSTDTIQDLLLNASGRSLPKALTRALRKALKEVARYKRITKDAKGEVDLQLYILSLIFNNFTGHFDSYYKVFFTSTVRLLLRTIQLIRKNLHEDYHLEYKPQLDDFLHQVHSRNKPLPVALPGTFEVA
ncbi:hypothetical protein I2I11_11560 [Pontibacter sp. 172403-2]|uniref:hypothetical protein n=1 Tax=Pontibacter rufus TaxID=2791028 RepID=UPI0018AF9125|nr:hypothetical protein [Pontibacter sp. 172403-2]MBF9253931.1 hypothetical protein [Pontibacter sp. 172403-2]